MMMIVLLLLISCYSAEFEIIARRSLTESVAGEGKSGKDELLESHCEISSAWNCFNSLAAVVLGKICARREEVGTQAVGSSAQVGSAHTRNA
jgi:hypothetical protein